MLDFCIVFSAAASGDTADAASGAAFSAVLQRAAEAIAEDHALVVAAYAAQILRLRNRYGKRRNGVRNDGRAIRAFHGVGSVQNAQIFAHDTADHRQCIVRGQGNRAADGAAQQLGVRAVHAGNAADIQRRAGDHQFSGFCRRHRAAVDRAVVFRRNAAQTASAADGGFLLRHNAAFQKSAVIDRSDTGSLLFQRGMAAVVIGNGRIVHASLQNAACRRIGGNTARIALIRCDTAAVFHIFQWFFRILTANNAAGIAKGSVHRRMVYGAELLRHLHFACVAADHAADILSARNLRGLARQAVLVFQHEHALLHCQTDHAAHVVSAAHLSRIGFFGKPDFAVIQTGHTAGLAADRNHVGILHAVLYPAQVHRRHAADIITAADDDALRHSAGLYHTAGAVHTGNTAYEGRICRAQ